MAINQNYHKLWFESFSMPVMTGHKDPVQLRLVSGQNLPGEIEATCQKRSTNPHLLLTECSRSLFYDYPVGTKFLLKAKLTDREGQGMFFYSYFNWKPYEIVRPA